MNYALESGEFFDVLSSQRDQYTQTLIGKCMDRYVTARQNNFEAIESNKVEISKKLEDAIEKIFSKCISDKDHKLALGIAIDSRRIDKVNI